MKKKIASFLLALVMCLGLLPTTALAAETSLPDWYFLFAIFKNVDADCDNGKGVVTHTTHSMTQEEIDTYRDNAKSFEAFMTGTGVMRAHVDVVEIDTVVTELEDSSSGSCLSSAQVASLLDGRVDLDQYDHVTSIISLNVGTSYVGRGGSYYENGTGFSTVNGINWEYCQKHFVPGSTPWTMQVYVHEFLHFMENMTKKWGGEFNLHDIRINHYTPDTDNGKECYTAIMQDRAIGDAGTGVLSVTWQYPPHVLRTMTELTVPSSVTSLGDSAFRDYLGLTSVTFSSGNVRVGDRTFWGLNALTSVTIPVSMTSIGYAAFWDTGVTDVYYAGTEAQWKAIQIGDYNEKLTRANIHYNHLMADVKTTDWFAKPVTWAVEQGVASGTGEGKFSPNSTCTQGQILTFLWRAYGSPEPSGKVSGSEYYAVPLQWAKEQKLVDESLSPKAPCTRADVVTYLWKLAGSPSAKAASFSDVSASASYAGAVNWAVENKITSGTGPDTFSPDKACTRGQIVTFLYQALK